MSGWGDGAGAGQLGFDALLASADAANEARRFARELPPFFCVRRLELLVELRDFRAPVQRRTALRTRSAL